MIREIEESDRAWLDSHAGDAWQFGPDYAGGLVYVDAQNKPVVAAGVWRRAETHLAVDSSWGTPGARDAAFTELHKAMEQRLYAQRVGEVVTYFKVTEPICKRLARLGWAKITRQVWGRKVGA